MAQGNSRKRALTELDDLQSAMSPSKSMRVHGVVTDLSPFKDTGFFQAKIKDGTASKRLIGFESWQWEQLSKHNNKPHPVQFDNCTIQKSRYSEAMEVVVNNKTKMSLSPRKIQRLQASIETIPLNKLNDVPDYDFVTVSAKVGKASEKIEVKSGLFKQDLGISDETATGRLTLWQQTIGSLTVGTSYSLQGLQVRSFNNKKYLSEPKSGFEFSVVKDIQAVPLDSDDQDEEVLNASITGAWVTNNRMCQACKGNIECISDQFGTCEKCNMTQKLDNCAQKLSTKVLIINGDKKMYLLVPIAMIRSIIGDPNISSDTASSTIEGELLSAKPFNFTYTCNNVISSVNK